MVITDAQRRFFATFGYIVLRGALREDIAWIGEEFDRVWRERDPARRGRTGSHPTLPVAPFIDQSARLCGLLDHPVLEPMLEGLVGVDFNYLGGDGRVYGGDTTWHWDGECTAQTPFYKVAVYLDPLTRDSGALRVIPGSHRPGEGFALAARSANRCEEELGMPAREVPCVALETEPGDVVLFHLNLVHGSCGGGARRMFAMLVSPKAETEEQRGALLGFLGCHAAPWGERVHGEIMRETATAGRRRHLAQVFAHEHHLPALHAAARAGAHA